MTTALLVLGSSLLIDYVYSCTSLLVSCGASASGSTMLAHAADCNDCDTTVALVAHRFFNETAMHPVRGMHHSFPREWSDRAAIYAPPGNSTYDQPLGYIPEVSETYAMWEAVYGLMNEHGLTIGESSTYARINSPGVDLENPSTHKKGPALFSIAMLIQIALERCKTAECAVSTMGSISEEYGFYAETFNAGESLSVADTTGDGWIFHILPDPTGNSSVWCARRVPDGHVAALANQFTISTIDKHDKHNYRHSENMYRVAEEQGLWDKSVDEFKFNKVFGTFGKLPMYSSLRLWHIYNSVAPSLKLTPHVDPFDFPFSVPVDKPVSVEDIMTIYRSHFEGTEFDMTKGVMAGPFANPQRVEAGDGITQVGGQITRAIAIQRTAYSFIGVADPENPLVYYATDTPSTSVYVPFLASTLKKAAGATPADLEHSRSLYSSRYQTGYKKTFDRFSAWWAFDFVANWMNINYRNMSMEYVYPAVELWQPKLMDVAKTRDETAISELTDQLVQFWWNLADTLVVRYNDGYFNYPERAPDKVFYTGYPADYLRLIGFDDGFVYPLGPRCDNRLDGQYIPFGERPSPSKNNETTIVIDYSEVNKTVEELHYLKDVVLPAKYAKTIIVNETMDDLVLPLMFFGNNSGTAEHVIAGLEKEMSDNTSLLWNNCLMIAIGIAIGYWVSRKTVRSNISHANSEDQLYVRIIE